jgi:hypothetical protein
MSLIRRSIGFDGRMFLDEPEWLTYCRRKPVRYIRRPRGTTCSQCGSSGLRDNPLQSAHIIGFDVGVIELGLTPEFLDSEKNIIIACRRKCNKKCELDLQASMRRLRDLGVQTLPKYLPEAVHKLWKATEA